MCWTSDTDVAPSITQKSAELDATNCPRTSSLASPSPLSEKDDVTFTSIAIGSLLRLRQAISHPQSGVHRPAISGRQGQGLEFGRMKQAELLVFVAQATIGRF